MAKKIHAHNHFPSFKASNKGYGVQA